ncbi:hypothetical protein [uncultured Sphaerochaeta sp.]|uniref:hypothetical protein n=1 Tax=uncultured Sphaerochaeta sp. TaxID=886478 RepID=UPI002AA90135|nr:hypothetical protein [uncultured Sphaerochaeta sp.]
MKKVEKHGLPILMILALLILGSQFLYAQDTSLLLALRIERASEEELIEMADLRGIGANDPAAIREALYEYHSIEHSRITSDEEESSYRLEITQARIMHTDADSSLLTLSGDVIVSFVGEGKQEPKQLRAQNVLIDLSHTLLTATGSVVFEDNGADAALQSIEGSVVTFDWSDETLTISGATTKSDRENSEDENVSIYTSGSLITYQGAEGGIYYQDGQIGTRSVDPLSSIRADRLSFLSGGDLMVHDAALYLGRVPVFWTPFFFFPGNQMVGNPSLGFTSDRGMFVSTTWEVYGSYPKFEESEQSSITKLLSSPDEEPKFPGKVLYTSTEELSVIQSWARKTDSYLTFFFDAYENAGLHAGYDSKTTFFSKRLTFDSLSAFALYPLGTSPIALYSDVGYNRYYLNQGIKLNTSWAKLDISMPLYSDPKVLSMYGNRLTSFAFDALLGKNQEFPTTYRSDITSFTWKMKGSFSLPTSTLSPYISSLNISNLEADALFKWQDDGPAYSYVLQQMHLPLFSLNLKGTLLDYSFTNPKTSETKDSVAEKEKDVLLPDAYQITVVNSGNASKQNEKFLSLSYSLEEKLTHTLNATLGVIDWDEAYLYSLTKGSVTLKASPNTKLFTISSEVLPQLTFLEDQSKSIYKTYAYQLFNVNTVAVPIIGLTYTLSQRLYRYQENFEKPLGSPVEIIEQEYAFDNESVTVHQVRFQQSFPLGEATITPSVTASLYPVKQSLLPSLKYVLGPLSLSSSLLFSEYESSLRKDTLKSSFAYTSKPLSVSLSGSYDFTRTIASWEDAMHLEGTAKEQFFSSFLTMSQRFSFSFLTSDGKHNYFDHITYDTAIPHLKVSYALKGESSALQAEKLQIDIAGKDIQLRWWKRRIALTLGIDSSLKFFYQDRYASSFSIMASARLQIAEFLDITLAAKSTNNGFFQYYNADDTFSYSLLWKDLLRSFDFSGDGRYNTQFNLSELSIILVHDLEDWSLNCKYSGSVVLSNNQYSWVPTVSVYLTWNTIPELDVEETWTQDNSVWTRSSSS